MFELEIIQLKKKSKNNHNVPIYEDLRNITSIVIKTFVMLYFNQLGNVPNEPLD